MSFCTVGGRTYFSSGWYWERTCRCAASAACSQIVRGRADVVLRNVRIPNAEKVPLSHRCAVRSIKCRVAHVWNCLKQVNLLPRQRGGEPVNSGRHFHTRRVGAKNHAPDGIWTAVLARDEAGCRRHGSCAAQCITLCLQPPKVCRSREALAALVSLVKESMRSGHTPATPSAAATQLTSDARLAPSLSRASAIFLHWPRTQRSQFLDVRFSRSTTPLKSTAPRMLCAPSVRACDQLFRSITVQGPAVYPAIYAAPPPEEVNTLRRELALRASAEYE